MKDPGNIERTKGWAALVALLKRTTQVDLAERLDLRQSAISAIVNLHKKPNVREVIALSKEGIEPELWVLPIGREARKGAA